MSHYANHFSDHVFPASGLTAPAVALTTATTSTAVPATVTPAVGYDTAASLAYYQAYYAQYATTAAAVAAHSSAWPVTGTAVYPVIGTSSSHASEGEAATAGDSEDETVASNGHHERNVLPVHGNAKTMNLNHLILTNIQQSHYFRNTLYEIRSFGDFVDEVWRSVKHCEPWERSTRQTGANSGMCGSVRGVSAGGVISTAFCCLFKLLSLRPTRKQLNSMIKKRGSPFIRSTGLLYLRYTQPPDQLWHWFSKFLPDDESFCPASVPPDTAHRHTITIGTMCRLLLTKQQWYSALFPRIPLPVQKDIEDQLKAYDRENGVPDQQERNGCDDDRSRKRPDKWEKNRDDDNSSSRRKRHRQPSCEPYDRRRGDRECDDRRDGESEVRSRGRRSCERRDSGTGRRHETSSPSHPSSHTHRHDTSSRNGRSHHRR